MNEKISQMTKAVFSQLPYCRYTCELEEKAECRLMDSNEYISGFDEYDYIHDDQVQWYAGSVASLSEGKDSPVPSMIFLHIPLREYLTAYELYFGGSPEIKYFFGNIGEKADPPICCSAYDSLLFEKAAELKSTKAIFCGHDHYNNISLEYKGIRLTYGMSIDYLAMPGISNHTKQRGATLITIGPDGGFGIEQVKLTDIE